MALTWQCTHCGKAIRADQSGGKGLSACPFCGKPLILDVREEKAPPATTEEEPFRLRPPASALGVFSMHSAAGGKPAEPSPDETSVFKGEFPDSTRPPEKKIESVQVSGASAEPPRVIHEVQEKPVDSGVLANLHVEERLFPKLPGGKTSVSPPLSVEPRAEIPAEPHSGNPGGTSDHSEVRTPLSGPDCPEQCPGTSDHSEVRTEIPHVPAPKLRLRKSGESSQGQPPAEAKENDSSLLELMTSIGNGSLGDELGQDLESAVLFGDRDGDEPVALRPGNNGSGGSREKTPKQTEPPPDETTDLPVRKESSSRLKQMFKLGIGCLVASLLILVPVMVSGWFLLRNKRHLPHADTPVQADATTVSADSEPEDIKPGSTNEQNHGLLPAPPPPEDLFGSERVDGVAIHNEREALAMLGLTTESEAQATPGSGTPAKLLTMPNAQRLRILTAFPKFFPDSPNKGQVYRELLLDTMDLLQGAGDSIDSLLVDYCRTALAFCPDYISLDIWNDEPILQCRRVVTELCSLDAARTAVLADADARTSLSDLMILLLEEFPAQRAANCRLAAMVLDAIGESPGWELLAKRLIETANEQLETAMPAPGGDNAYVNDAVRTAARLAKCLPAMPDLVELLYVFARHLQALGNDLEAIHLVQVLEENTLDAAWKTRCHRKRRTWDPDLALRDVILLRRNVADAINERLPAALEGINRELIARDIGLQWPVNSPRRSLAEVEKAIQETADAAAETTFPLVTLKNIEEEANRTFRAFAIGDEVQLHLKPGVPGGPLLRGKFRERYPGRVKIAFRMVSASDIVEEDRIRLYPEECETRRQAYIRTHEDAFNRSRKECRQEVAREASARLYPEAGYILRNDDWVSPLALLDGAVARRRNEVKTALEAAVETEIYTREGFVRTATGWQPSDPDADRTP